MTMAAPSLFANVGAAFGRLTERERRLVLLLAAVFSILVIAAGVWIMGSIVEGREKRVAQRRSELVELEALREKYDEATQVERRNTMRIRGNSASLFSVLQKAAAEVGLSLTDLNERRIPVKDSAAQEVTVDVNLKEVSIDKLHTLLEKIEGKRGDGVIKVTKMRTRTRFDAPDMLEVSMTVSTWKQAAGASAAADGATP